MTEGRGEDEQPLYDDGDDKVDKKAALNSHDGGSNAEEDSEKPTVENPQFNPPPPSPWKRLGLLVLVILLFYFAFQMRSALNRKPKVVYASRYSKEHKFRPAASPVITETLKDGRVRVRGALPTPTSTAAPTNTTAKKRRSTQAGRAGGKAKRKAPAVARE